MRDISHQVWKQRTMMTAAVNELVAMMFLSHRTAARMSCSARVSTGRNDGSARPKQSGMVPSRPSLQAFSTPKYRWYMG